MKNDCINAIDAKYNAIMEAQCEIISIKPYSSNDGGVQVDCSCALGLA